MAERHDPHLSSFATACPQDGAWQQILLALADATTGSLLAVAAMNLMGQKKNTHISLEISIAARLGRKVRSTSGLGPV
jgi:hypothetical protein